MNMLNDLNVRNNPSLSRLLITNFGAAVPGSVFWILVKAENIAGLSAFSDVTAVVLADVPSKPTDIPVNDLTSTSDSQIKVSFATPPPNNGGSPILSYELQIDDGKFGVFRSVIGFDSNSLFTVFTITKNIEKGSTYWLRYWAKNSIGWGPFSDEVVVLAATIPSRPPKPTFNRYSIADDKVYIDLYKVENNGGSQMLYYELYWDAGDDYTSAFTIVKEIVASDTLSYSALNGVDAILGKTYRYKVRANNTKGFSEFSDEAFIAFGDKPPRPPKL